MTDADGDTASAEKDGAGGEESGARDKSAARQPIKSGDGQKLMERWGGQTSLIDRHRHVRLTEPEKKEGVRPIEGAQPPVPNGPVEPGRPLADSAVKKHADHGAVSSTEQRREDSGVTGADGDTASAEMALHTVKTEREHLITRLQGLRKELAAQETVHREKFERIKRRLWGARTREPRWGEQGMERRAREAAREAALSAIADRERTLAEARKEIQSQREEETVDWRDQEHEMEGFGHYLGLHSVPGHHMPLDQHDLSTDTP